MLMDVLFGTHALERGRIRLRKRWVVPRRLPRVSLAQNAKAGRSRRMDRCGLGERCRPPPTNSGPAVSSVGKTLLRSSSTLLVRNTLLLAANGVPHRGLPLSDGERIGHLRPLRIAQPLLVTLQPHDKGGRGHRRRLTHEEAVVDPLHEVAVLHRVESHIRGLLPLEEVQVAREPRAEPGELTIRLRVQQTYGDR